MPHTERPRAPRHAFEVLIDHLDEERRDALEVFLAKPPDDAEVDEPETAVVGDDDVRRVRGAVEQTVVEHHRSHVEAILLDQGLALPPMSIAAYGHIGDLHARDQLRRQHLRRV